MRARILAGDSAERLACQPRLAHARRACQHNTALFGRVQRLNCECELLGATNQRRLEISAEAARRSVSGFDAIEVPRHDRMMARNSLARPRTRGPERQADLRSMAPACWRTRVLENA